MLARLELREEVAAPASMVFRLLSASERLPELCPRLGRVAVIWRGRGLAFSRWETRLGSRLLTWTQRDTFDRGRWLVGYRLIYGDLASLEGEWAVEEACECSSLLRASLRLEPHPPDAKLALPWRLSMLRNLRAVIEGVRARLEARPD
jgi:ribosome-associated toxin RatA of RatAB toxin-antitoxin module